MKITRIEKIKKHLIFKDFKWSSALSDFETFNLIYGWNGSGKTTLANLFRCIEKHTEVPSGEFSVQIDGRTVSSSSFPIDQSLPQVRVFDKDFIDENVFTTTGSLAPIFYLGVDSIEKQKTLESLKKSLELKNKEYATKDDRKRSLERDLDRFTIDQAKTIKELLSSSGINVYNNYDKASFKKKVRELSSLQNASTKKLSETDKINYKKQKESTAKSTILPMSLALPDTTDLLNKVNIILQKTVVSEIIQALKENHELSNWIKDGLSLHKKSKTKECLFCEQPLPVERLKKIESHFNDQYNQFTKEIDMLIKDIETYEKVINGFIFHDKAKFYDHLSVEYENEATYAKEKITSVIDYLNILKTNLQKKKDSPFQAFEYIKEENPVVFDIFIPINTIIDKHNLETNNFVEIIDNARLKLEEDLVIESLTEFNNKNDSIKAASEEIIFIQKEIVKISSEIKDIEKQIIEHRKPADELNSDLGKYLGHTDLIFDVKETGYQIARHGNPASGLSEGEKTAIAFLYFLKSLHDKSFNINNGIIIVDDPVSSLDANSLYYAFGFMKERVKNVGQLFVLTHNFAFFRQVKNWYHHVPQNKKTTRFYMIESSYSGTIRSANLLPLDNLLHQYDSEYQYLFKLVYSSANITITGQPLENFYHLPNIARRLLEAFLSFKHPKSSGGELNTLIKEISFDEAKKSRILRFLHTHSHHGHIDDPEHDISILSETPQILADVIKLIEENDKNHYDELVEIVTTK